MWHSHNCHANRCSKWWNHNQLRAWYILNVAVYLNGISYVTSNCMHEVCILVDAISSYTSIRSGAWWPNKKRKRTTPYENTYKQHTIIFLNSTIQYKQMIAVNFLGVHNAQRILSWYACLWRSVSLTMFSYGRSDGKRCTWWLPVHI